MATSGRKGRDFIALLDLHDQREQYEHRLATISRRIDLFEPTDGSTLLRQLQDDIRDLRPLAETRARWPAVDPAHDRSIRFHVTHGPQREVEVLHDELLAAFEADSTLRARDVIVMVPDIDAYAAHVQAVFGLHEPGDPKPDELEIARAIEAVNAVTTLGLRSVRTAWAGLRTFAPDGNPVARWDAKADGFFHYVGQAGYGIQMAPALAQLAAPLIRER